LPIRNDQGLEIHPVQRTVGNDDDGICGADPDGSHHGAIEAFSR
jgi:hypothetical protein